MTSIVIITGASSGIGAVTARMAAQKGYAVALNYLRNEEGAEGVASGIRESGGRAICVQADVSEENDVVRLFETVDCELGRVTALVNNAATLERQMRVESMDAARLQRMFATNAIGSFLCAREAVRRMSTRRGGDGGAIVNVSSGASKYGSPGEYVDYAATKGAIDTMTVGLAREVAEEGIRVNCVRPGFIYTGLHAKGGEPERVERVKGRAPMQRGGQPEEVAAAILWLLSGEASYVTGDFGCGWGNVRDGDFRLQLIERLNVKHPSKHRQLPSSHVIEYASALDSPGSANEFQVHQHSSA